MKKTISLILIFIMACSLFLMTACSPQTPAAASPSETAKQSPAESSAAASSSAASSSAATSPSESVNKPFKAALVEVQANIFYDLIDSGVRDVVEKNGGTLLRSISEFDIQKELSLVEEYLLQKIDVLFLSVADPVGSAEAIRKCNDAGVPVICLASEPAATENAKVITYTKSDDVEAGMEVAEYIFKQINYKGDVIIVDGPQITCVLDRVSGYKKILEKYPDLKLAGHAIVDEHSISGNIKTIENLLQANPGTKAILTYCGYGIPAAATALANLNRKDIWVGEVDGIPEECELIASGEVLGATIGQQPYQFGVKAAEAYLKYRADKNADIPLWTKVEHKLITKENAASWDAYDPKRNKFAEEKK